MPPALPAVGDFTRRQISNREAYPGPHSAAFRIAGREQLIGALSGEKLRIVALLHDQARRAPDVEINHFLPPILPPK